ncbi:MAG: GTP-binding protein TypA/BipA [Acidimicrobiales bacterium]
MPTRSDLRNLAIVAHVDHGKTTLVDAMLRQSGVFRANQEVAERVMDSMDLEREKGITILAKQTALPYKGVKLNIVDTPGHADFGGEVERGLSMVDGILLLVDAAEGPLPQTRFVLRKALEAALPIVVVINKVDRSDARPAEVLDAVYDLFIDLGADGDQLDFPVAYASARAGWAVLEEPAVGVATVPEGSDGTLGPLMDLVLSHVPAPTYEEGHPFQALVTNLDASPYLGRLAICRVVQGHLSRGAPVAWCRRDGSIERAKAAQVFVTEALERVEAAVVGPGEIVAVAGLAEVTIGETLADPDDPRPLPLLSIDEPSLSMTFGVNTSPMVGRSSATGKKLTARLIKTRLDAELVGNVSIRVLPTERPDTWEVQGRGELALAVLVELMRREGFELTVGKPQVLTRLIDGKVHEPVERLEVDVPDEHFGTLTQLLALRKGRLERLVNHGGGAAASGSATGSAIGSASVSGDGSTGGGAGTGWVRMELVIPARGLIGIRTEVLTQTRGTAQIHHAFHGWEPWAGEMRGRASGSMVSDRSGITSTYALMNLQERGSLLVGPGEQVYEGMVIGESSRGDDMDVNPTKERKLTNMRSSTSEELVRLSPPRKLTLEAALELITEDECVEVTADAVRVRKVVLPAAERGRSRSVRNRAELAANAG